MTVYNRARFTTQSERLGDPHWSLMNARRQYKNVTRPRRCHRILQSTTGGDLYHGSPGGEGSKQKARQSGGLRRLAEGPSSGHAARGSTIIRPDISICSA
jgi:hypothetical protein